MRGVIALSLAACAAAAPSVSFETVHGDAAPILSSSNAEAIPNSYIIKFKKHVTDNSATAHQNWIQEIHTSRETERADLKKRGQSALVDDVFRGLKHTYKIGQDFVGYAGHFDDEVIEQVRRHPDVEYIERDSIVHTMRVTTQDKCDGETEKGAPWGLARISHRDTLSFSTFNKYLFAAEGGEGVDAYVIDTGVNIKHLEFEGRAKWGKTIPKGAKDFDGNGHGTHCAGTIGSRKYGVAKGANIIAVKVLGDNGSGSMSDVISGILWAAEEASAKDAAAAKELAATGKTKHKGSVANMSLGGGKSQTTDDAVNAAVDAGLHFAGAAGNDNKDACNYSPAAAEKAVTVGASTLSDTKAYFSNDGPCVDVFAPGLNILSTWSPGNSSSNTISGTSMASPHVCGLLAYLLSIHGSETFTVFDSDEASGMTVPADLYSTAYSFLPRVAQAFLPKPSAASFAPTPKDPATLTPAKLKTALIKLASKGVIADLDNKTANLLVFNNATTTPLKKKAM